MTAEVDDKPPVNHCRIGLGDGLKAEAVFPPKASNELLTKPMSYQRQMPKPREHYCCGDLVIRIAVRTFDIRVSSVVDLGGNRRTGKDRNT